MRAIGDLPKSSRTPYFAIPMKNIAFRMRRYGLARMTTFSVRASLNNVEVWSEPEGNNLESGRWTYFFLRRNFQ